MLPRFETLAEKKLTGRRLKMSFAANKTAELWQSFMPHRREIKNSIGTELYSAEVYSARFFEDLNPEREFDKWAATEVSDFATVPAEMETLIFPAGLYAVFLHQGTPSTGAKTYHYIFETWLPNSDFLIDDRPHFAIMGEKYKGKNPGSEEEIWIPINLKASVDNSSL